MTVGATKIRALADKIHPTNSEPSRLETKEEQLTECKT
ncbi:hypothetical protein DSOL_1165 [Desulfosporosinus metallidurans]|uniref:Uncharacterized protein n=1 Tax=Desulfosporosinus metallidurans TaxID=1888891 RepID=A0A1Q8R0C7_9FIRM|nr:hypothetical protein DSOL_1165 [Desulfosporosinus metallidurans]